MADEETSTSGEIIKKQIAFLKQAVDILSSRIQEIEKVARGNKYSSGAEAEMKSAINVFKVRSIKFYKDSLHYIAKETERNDNIYFFLFPHVRTLLDIYGRFIHLIEICKDERKQALTCIACQLFLPKYLGSELEYLKTLSFCSKFLKKENFIFPTSVSIYSRKWVEGKGLSFQNMSTLITSANVKKYSRDIYNIFNPDGNYALYSSFSEFIHGNPYYYDAHKNEKFWVLAISLSTTAFFIEIIDLYTLNKTGARDFRIWTEEVKKNRAAFANLWKEQNK